MLLYNIIMYRRIIEAMDDDEDTDVGDYIEKYNKKDKSTCKDVQDDYYSTIISDDENDFQECNTNENESKNERDEGHEKNNTVSGFGHGVKNGRNNRNNQNFDKEKKSKSTENKTNSESSGQQNTVLQVIENDMLSNNMGKTGDIYRSLRSRWLLFNFISRDCYHYHVIKELATIM